MNLTIRIKASRGSLKAITLIAVVAVLIVAGAVIASRHKSQPLPPHTSQNGNFSAGQRSAEVTIRNMMFTPSQVTVVRGTTVTWTNDDSMSHTVTIDQGTGPKSSNIAPGASFAYTFNQSGSYQYHCSIHPSMRGTIVVQ